VRGPRAFQILEDDPLRAELLEARTFDGVVDELVVFAEEKEARYGVELGDRRRRKAVLREIAVEGRGGAAR
jgi:hypothetical protein